MTSGVSYYSGRVHSLIYSDPASSFYILRMLLDDGVDPPKKAAPSTGDPLLDSLLESSGGDPVSVKGYIPGVSVDIGSWFGFEACWSSYKGEKQLNIKKAPVFKDTWDADTVVKILMADGVSEYILTRIRQHFVTESEFTRSLSKVEELEKVPGVDRFTAALIVERWRTARVQFQTIGFLADLGLPASIVDQCYRIFKDEAKTILSENPWALTQIEGIKFNQADEIARKLGLSPDSPQRLRGAVLHVCKGNTSFGHLYLTTGQVVGEVQAMIPNADKRDVAKALAQLHKDKLLFLDKECRPGMTAVYDPWFYKVEKESAAWIVQRQKTAVFGHDQSAGNDRSSYLRRLCSMGATVAKVAEGGDLEATITAAIEFWGESANLRLSTEQKRGVFNALTEPVSILTGLPGTGKTTSLKAAVRILQECDIPFLLCAPTGIAAKNLSMRTGARASTIHRAFDAKGKREESRKASYVGVQEEVATTRKNPQSDDRGSWGYGSERTYPAEVIVVDETSMVDQALFYRLMECTSGTCRVVLVGDAAQLPSVGPGNVLRDMISSGRFPMVNLTEIFRQQDTETSAIVKAAHAIYRGDVPDFSSPDFKLVPIASEDVGLDIILKLASRLYEKRENFQILSPRHAGVLGVTNLNSRLRELLNPKRPGQTEVKLGNDTVREDDRIMVTQNNYKLEIFNGDVGKVSRIDRKAKEVEIKIFGDVPMLVSLPFAEVPRTIRMAYACTVHKAQGLEYDHIVMPIVDGFKHQLQRNLLYTAVTRAKKRVILVGTETALTKAVQNAKEDARNTLFVDRLKTA